MATTDAQICNLALLRIGSTATIDSLAESTDEARACNVLYEQHRDALLSAFPWPFATKRATPAPLTEKRSGWAYAYSLPSDFLGAQEIWSGLRRPRHDQRIRYAIESGVLLTDAEEVELIYTARAEEVRQFPPLFVDALAWTLAADLALALAVREGMHARAREEAELARQRAACAAVNEQVPDIDPEAQTVAIQGVWEDPWCR